MDIIGHLPIDLYSSKYIYRVAMTSKEHGLKKYKLVNALTMDNPLSLVEKIKQVPEDYERYKFYLCELDQDPGLSLNIIETSRVAAMLMQLERYDSWSYEKNIDELMNYETTNERMRKMNEYVLNYLQRARNTNIIQDSVGAAQELLMELKGEDGGLKVEWKKQQEIIDIEVDEND